MFYKEWNGTIDNIHIRWSESKLVAVKFNIIKEYIMKFLQIMPDILLHVEMHILEW
jgi:hypothetical protein